MADYSSNPIASLYPQPAPPIDPSHVLGMVGQINALQQFQANRAIGQHIQQSIGTDGSLDAPGAMKAIAGDPTAAIGAAQGVSNVLALRQQAIGNANAQLNLNVANQKAIAEVLAPYAAKANPTPEDLYNAKAQLARLGVDPNILAAWGSGTGPNGLKQLFGTAANYAMGPAAAAGRVTGPPEPGTNAPTQTSTGAISLGGPTFPVAPPPGVTEAQSGVGSQSGAQLAADLSASNNFRRSVFPLEQAIPALERLGTSGTGPGTETLNNVKSFVQSLGLPGVDASKIKDYDEANKYLTDFVNQNGATGTNDKLAAAFAGNPSVKISNAAAVDVAKSALALRRMQQTQVMEFARTGLPESQYSKWASTWQTQHDPRAEGFDLMTPDAQQKLISSLKGPERARFISSLQAADRSQVIAPPQAPNGQQ